jgi:uncharacterized membrane protein (DUF2068 family)
MAQRHSGCGFHGNRQTAFLSATLARNHSRLSLRQTLTIGTFTLHHLQLSDGVRAVAVVEALKGAVVLLAGFGLISLLHRDIQSVAMDLVRHLHLSPASYYPHVFLALMANVSDRQLWLFAGLAFGYSVMRFVEAYALWLQRRWGEWFAAGSGALYLPLEIYELSHGVSGIKVLTLTINLIVVGYMALVLAISRNGGSRPWHAGGKSVK